MSDTGDEKRADQPATAPKRGGPGLMARLRSYLLAGILVTAPISITLWLVWGFITFVDSRVKPLLPPAWDPERYLPIGVPGIGVVIAVLGLTFIGMFAAGYIGRFLTRMSDRLLAKVPVVRSIYSATKQVFETVLAQRAKAFREVAMVEYPHRGVWSMGFVTGTTTGEVQNRIATEVVTVFVPATPNPTTGFLLFLPKDEIRILDMTVEQGLKMLISGGIITPEEQVLTGETGQKPSGKPPSDSVVESAYTQPEEGSGNDSTVILAKPVDLRLGFMARMRAYFFAGILVTAPIAITIWLAWQFIGYVDSKVKPMLPPAWNPETYLEFSVPGVGLVIVLVALTLIGMVTTGILGRTMHYVYDRLLAAVPLLHSIYNATRQVLETVLAKKSEAFREVVLFEYPRRGCWSLGFITGTTRGQIQELTTDTVINVFLPTTPNPTSGFLLFVPKRDMTILSMTIEEGIKMVVSGGIIVPPDRRPEADQQEPTVVSGENAGSTAGATALRQPERR